MSIWIPQEQFWWSTLSWLHCAEVSMPILTSPLLQSGVFSSIQISLCSERAQWNCITWGKEHKFFDSEIPLWLWQRINRLYSLQCLLQNCCWRFGQGSLKFDFIVTVHKKLRFSSSFFSSSKCAVMRLCVCVGVRCRARWGYWRTFHIIKMNPALVRRSNTTECTFNRTLS